MGVMLIHRGMMGCREFFRKAMLEINQTAVNCWVTVAHGFNMWLHVLGVISHEAGFW